LNRCPSKTDRFIDRDEETGRRATFKDQKQDQSWRFVMPSRTETAGRARARTRARLELEAIPISDDADLLKLKDQAEEFLREAKRRDPSQPDELISTVVDAVSRKYFRSAIRKQRA
jgi:hypothetical protein